MNSEDEYEAEDINVADIEDNDRDEIVEDEEDDDNNSEEGEEEGGDDDEEEDNEETTDSQTNSTVLHATPALASLTNPQRLLQIREIGHLAVWSLSTAKPGNGVTQIRDSSTDTYWQSDGGQPHLINIQFSKRVAVCEVAFYLDYSLDESYTPKRLSVRTGITFHDLVEVKVVELNEPVGWVSIPLSAPLDPLDDEEEEDDEEEDNNNNEDDEDDLLWKKMKRPIRTHFVQVCVVSMHQNGRDTHMRQVKIFGPRMEEGGQPTILSNATRMMGAMSLKGGDQKQLTSSSKGLLGISNGATPKEKFVCGPTRFQTVEMSQFSTLR